LKLVIWGVYPILRHTEILFWQLWGNQISTQPSSEHRPVDADWAACCCHQKLTDPPKAWETTVITLTTTISTMVTKINHTDHI
jgi:hypothetical protein